MNEHTTGGNESEGRPVTAGQRRPGPPSWRRLATAGALAGAIALLAGCGSSDDTTTSTAATSSATASESDAGTNPKQAAKDFVAANSDLENLDWPKPPDEPYDPGKGKIGIVTTGLTGSGAVEMGKEAVRAAKAAGWEPTEPLDGKFTPSVQSGLVQRLVAEKVDAIVLISIQPGTIATAVNAAIDAGIPITNVYSANDKEFKTWGGPVTTVTQDGRATGEAIAAYIAANSDGETRVDVVGNDPGFPILQERTAGLKAGLEKYCPECELKVTQLSAGDLAKPGPPAFSALLSSNPAGTLDWVVGGPADPFGELIMKTVEQQGRTDIKMVGADSSPTVLENLSEGGTTKANILAGYRYAAWAGVEQAIRQHVGLEPWRADTIPGAFITSENVQEVLSQLPKYYAPPSFDYEAMFNELWSGQ